MRDVTTCPTCTMTSLGPMRAPKRGGGGTYHLHVTVYCLVHLQYCDSSPEHVSMYLVEILPKTVNVITSYTVECLMLASI